MDADLVWIVPAALGALGLAVVVVPRLFARWRFRRRLRSQTRRLAAFAHSERLRGAVAVVELGLTRRTAGTLLDHIADEDDERVRLAIAEAVTSHDGKRSRRRLVRRLRRWAADELADRGQGRQRATGAEAEEAEEEAAPHLVAGARTAVLITAAQRRAPSTERLLSGKAWC